jgi:uncharacterized membrane protein YoaT (DUF817 family)
MIRHSRFFRIRDQLERAAVTPGWPGALFEFSVFVFKQGWACLFGALMLFALLATHFFWPDGAPIYRYDALTLYAIAVQAAMLALRLETPREASVILIFHVVGTIMELFKTAAGSWVYPEAALLRIGGVPLFSGFMYAAVGSYIARVWRGFDFRFSDYPPLSATWLLAIAVYVNFFAHHWVMDMRWLLFGGTAILFWRCRIWFRPLGTHRSMPLLVGFGLVALFIWFAENLGTFARAWTYPSQSDGWHMVPLTKLGSWYLLMIISFVLVSTVSPIRAPEASRSRRDAAPLPKPARQEG